MLPIVLGGLVQPIDDVVIAQFDREFPAIVEAARGEVDRPNDRGDAVGTRWEPVLAGSELRGFPGDLAELRLTGSPAVAG